MEIKYSKIGDGPTHIIVLPGWMSDHSIFDPWIELLDRSAFTYYFVDYRGYGLSREMTGEFSIDEIATDVVELARALDLSRYDLVGHSMGGMVAVKVALRDPGSVRKLVGITPVPASGFPMDENTAGLFEGAIENIENRKQIIDFTTGSKHGQDWLQRIADQSVARTEKTAFAKYLTAWTKTDFHEEAAGLDLPALLLVGENDPAISKDLLVQTNQQWLKNCEIKQLPDVGHYPMQEDPANLQKEIEAFFAQ